MQYLLICRADVAVSAESKAPIEELNRDMLQEFTDAVDKFSYGRSPLYKITTSVVVRNGRGRKIK